MVTCNRLAAKAEDRFRFTFELRNWRASRKAAAMLPRLRHWNTRDLASCHSWTRKARTRNDGASGDTHPAHLSGTISMLGLAVQMGMESPDNRPAVDDLVG